MRAVRGRREQRAATVRERVFSVRIQTALPHGRGSYYHYAKRTQPIGPLPHGRGSSISPVRPNQRNAFFPENPMAKTKPKLSWAVLLYTRKPMPADSESQLLAWIREQQKTSKLVRLAAGDDLAVLDWPQEDLLLVGNDQVLDGVHFDSAQHP